MREQTLVLIKPDAVYSGWARKITDRYAAANLRFVEEHQIQMSRNQAARFYAEHRGKFFFKALVLAMSSGEVNAIILEGDEAISRVRELNGATNPDNAQPGTIRHDFKSAGGVFNTVHGSANAADAEREIELIHNWIRWSA